MAIKPPFEVGAVISNAVMTEAFKVDYRAECVDPRLLAHWFLSVIMQKEFIVTSGIRGPSIKQAWTKSEIRL